MQKVKRVSFSWGHFWKPVMIIFLMFLILVGSVISGFLGLKIFLMYMIFLSLFISIYRLVEIVLSIRRDTIDDVCLIPFYFEVIWFKDSLITLYENLVLWKFKNY